MRYKADQEPCVPVGTGQVVSVGADDVELLRLLFGEHAGEVGEAINRDRPIRQYVQIKNDHKTEEA